MILLLKNWLNDFIRRYNWQALSNFWWRRFIPSVFEKAAALGESLIINNPFIDGNKRTGAVAMVALLEDEGLVFSASEEDFYRFVISISTGEKKFDEIVDWLKENTEST